ncbi:MAG: AraC family ligand binding domain-containing protein, partial [Gallintestinimicrobium sp.]
MSQTLTDIRKISSEYGVSGQNPGSGSVSDFQICDLSCSSDYQYPPHQQICFEISYIVSGHGIYERNNVPYEVTPNTVFLVNDHDLHAVRSSKDDPLRYMCLGFSFCKEHPDFEKYLPLYNFFEHLENPIAEDHFKLFDCF